MAKLGNERTDELIFELRKRGYVTLAEGENSRLRGELDALRGQVQMLESECDALEADLSDAEAARDG